MTTIEDIREKNNELIIQCQKEFKDVLEKYLESVFIECNKPWRAIKGKKRVRPFPIHRVSTWICSDGSEELRSWSNEFPNLAEEIILKEFEKLGFIVTKDKVCLLVPMYKGEKELTFAQNWVKKINTNYSEYCKKEYEKAERIYSECLSRLNSMSKENVKIFEDYAIYLDFKYADELISPKCHTRIKKLMLRDGIEEYFEGDKYIGLKVLNKVTDN